MKSKGMKEGVAQGISQGISQGTLRERHEILQTFLSNGGTKEMAIKLLGVTAEEVAQAELDIKQKA